MATIIFNHINIILARLFLFEFTVVYLIMLKIYQYNVSFFILFQITAKMSINILQLERRYYCG